MKITSSMDLSMSGDDIKCVKVLLVYDQNIFFRDYIKCILAIKYRYCSRNVSTSQT